MAEVWLGYFRMAEKSVLIPSQNSLNFFFHDTQVSNLKANFEIMPSNTTHFYTYTIINTKIY